jgi:putative peptidoglycan lipid II flippase
LLCLPAALALSVASGPLISALFEGGRFTAQDASITALTLAIIVTGLPAYVLVKVLTPGFYSRQDTATPVKTAGVTLMANILLNFALIPPFGIAGLAAAIAICSWLNCLMLYIILHRRGHFRIESWLALRIGKQLVAGVAMAAALWFVKGELASFFAGSVGHRLIGVGALIGSGMAVYFPIVWIIGGMGKEDIQALLRRRGKPGSDSV